MSKIKKITIVGDGGWGTTLAIHCFQKSYAVSIWGAFPEYIGQLKKNRVNSKFLPGVRIPDGIDITSSLEEALSGADVTVLAVPSQFMRSVISKMSTLDLPGSLFISVTKGIENRTLKRMSEVAEEVLGSFPFGVLSGPTIAQEVAAGIPTTAVAASKEPGTAKLIQDIFSTDRFRVYVNTDVIGVELGGSLKNIVAIAAGISDGLGFGTNAKAALLTRGLAEIVRLGVAMGADRETFFGLSGLGDLATTCMSRYSRNRTFGEEIGKKKRPKDILKATEMVIEGVTTARSAFELSKKYSVEMPIIEQIHAILYENKDPVAAVHDLMTRSPKSEVW